jgi:hypothetical protein
MKKLYQGGCHCGAVRYTVNLDLQQGTFRCNCSLCRKARAWFTSVAPDEFTLLKGGEMLTDYRWTPPGKDQPNLTYHFCKNCGVRIHTNGRGLDGKPMIAVHLASLEGADAEDLANSIHYVDGASDRFDREPADTRAL